MPDCRTPATRRRGHGLRERDDDLVVRSPEPRLEAPESSRGSARSRRVSFTAEAGFLGAMTGDIDMSFASTGSNLYLRMT